MSAMINAGKHTHTHPSIPNWFQHMRTCVDFVRSMCVSECLNIEFQVSAPRFWVLRVCHNLLCKHKMRFKIDAASDAVLNRVCLTWMLWMQNNGAIFFSLLWMRVRYALECRTCYWLPIVLAILSDRIGMRVRVPLRLRFVAFHPKFIHLFMTAICGQGLTHLITNKWSFRTSYRTYTEISL